MHLVNPMYVRIPLKYRLAVVLGLLAVIYLTSCKTTKNIDTTKQTVDSVSHTKTDSSAYKYTDTSSVKKEVKEWENVLEVEYDSGVIVTPINPKDFTSIIPNIKGPIKKVTIKSKGKEVSKDSVGKKEVHAVSKSVDNNTELHKDTKQKSREVKRPPAGVFVIAFILIALLVLYYLFKKYPL